MQTDEYRKLFEHEDRYWWFVGRRKLALALLKKYLPTGRPERLLDLGCGTGAALAEMDQLGPSVGLDFSELALEYSAERGLKDLVAANGEHLPFADNSFKGMIALDIFEHIPDHEQAYREAFRVLAPGGVLVLSVPAYRWLWGPHDVALMHFRRYRKSEVRTCLQEAGFRVEKLSYSIFFLFPVVVLVRLLDKFKRGEARVHLPEIPKSLNQLLVKLQNVETTWICRSHFPWGSSVVAVAKKPTLMQ